MAGSKGLEHGCRIILLVFLLSLVRVGGRSCSNFLASAVRSKVPKQDVCRVSVPGIRQKVLGDVLYIQVQISRDPE